MTMTQKLVKLKIKLLLIMILTNIVLLKNLTSENFTARLKQANSASESDIANFLKKTDLNNNQLNELSEKVKVILTKRLKKF